MNDPQQALGEIVTELGKCLDIIAEQRRVDLELRAVEPLAGDSLPEGFSGPCVVARSEFTRDGSPSACALLFQTSDCLIYVGLMLGLDPGELQNRMEQGFGEDDVEAFGEAMNQAFPKSIGAANELLGGSLQPAVPTTRIQDLRNTQDLELPRPLLAGRIDLQIEGFDRSSALILWPSEKAAPIVPSFPEPPSGPRTREISRAMKIEIPITVLLAKKEMTMHEVFALAPGSIIEFTKSSEDFLHLLVGDRPYAQGEAAKSGDKFCFRVKKIAPPGPEEPAS